MGTFSIIPHFYPLACRKIGFSIESTPLKSKIEVEIFTNSKKTRFQPILAFSSRLYIRYILFTGDENRTEKIFSILPDALLDAKRGGNSC